MKEKKTIIELRNDVVYIDGVNILEENEKLIEENNFLRKENQDYIDVINTLNTVVSMYNFVKLKIKNIEIQELVRKVNNNEKYYRKNNKKNK